MNHSSSKEESEKEKSEASFMFRMKSVGFLSFRLAHFFERRLDQRLTRHGVNIGQLRVMFVLWEATEATQTDIARHLGVAQPTIAKTLERMVRDGLAATRPDPTHGKRVLVRLTRKAHALREVLLREAQAVNEIAMAAMSQAEQAQVVSILTRLGNALETSG